MSALPSSTVFTTLSAPRVRRGSTVLLLSLGTTLFLGSALLVESGVMPLALHLVVGGGALVVMMVVAHDAIHFAAHSDVRVNRFIGWLASFACGVPFVMLASNHLRHHRHVDTEADPERFCLGPAWQLPLRGPAMLVFYYLDTWPRLDRSARRAVILFVLVELFALVLMPSLVVTWLAPLLVAAFLFATFTVWLPHGPFGDLVMRVAPVLTGYHDDHHARPAMPALQYGELHRWHRATGVVTRQDPTRRSAVMVGQSLATELLASATTRAVQLDGALQAATVELLGTEALAPLQRTHLALRRRGGLASRWLSSSFDRGLDLLLADCLRQLSLHPRVRARVEAGLELGARRELVSFVTDVARRRGDAPDSMALAVDVLVGLLSVVRLDVRMGSPVRPPRGLEVRVHRRQAA